MKNWEKPSVTALSVEATKFGQDITEHVDDVMIWNTHTYYSFS